MANLAEEARALAAEVFTDPDLIDSISLRAVIRLTDAGEFNPQTLSADPSQLDLPCRAILDSHEGRRQAALAIDPRAEIWLLQGVPATLNVDIYESAGLAPLKVSSDRQFEPGEGHLLLVAEVNGPDAFEHSDGAVYQGRARAILQAQDTSVGTGAVWSVVCQP